MALTLAAAGLIGAGIGAGANLIGNTATNILNVREAKKTREFNAEQAALDREFQKEMAQNNLKYIINQAKELGISPSLILGDQTNALGGSKASASGGQANITNTGIASATNGILNAINEQYKLKTLEEINEDKLQTMKDIQNMRMGNSTNNKENRYNKEELDNLFSNLEIVKV